MTELVWVSDDHAGHLHSIRPKIAQNSLMPTDH